MVGTKYLFLKPDSSLNQFAQMVLYIIFDKLN